MEYSPFCQKHALTLLFPCRFCQITDGWFCLFFTVCKTNLQEASKPERRLTCKALWSDPDKTVRCKLQGIPEFLSWESGAGEGERFPL